MKIAIFGGSFNPPHIMHKQIALSLINNKYCDKVIFVPTGDKYNKEHLVDDMHRLNMLKIMCEGNTNLCVSDYELHGDLKYTYQTLDHFQEKYEDSEIFFVLGFDNLKSFKSWRRFEYILSKYKLLVVDRDNIDENYLKEEFEEFLDSIIFTTVYPQKISSSSIRKELKKFRISELIEPEVLEYIEDNKLYI